MRLLRSAVIAACFLSLALAQAAFAGQPWTLYVGNGCPHCAKVEEFMAKDAATYSGVAVLEIYSNDRNRDALLKEAARLGISDKDVRIPFLITSDGRHGAGDVDVIVLLKTIGQTPPIASGYSTGSVSQEIPLYLPAAPAPWAVLLALLPAALADSVNPCEFAILLLLLGAILEKSGSRKRALLAGLAFTFSIFVSYFLMGAGLYSVFAGHAAAFWFKITVGSLGVLIGLANLKDAFWWGKWFVMEVPFSWRPRMAKIVEKLASPAGALVSGFVVSLFLLPCTSGPYLTALGYLSSKEVGAWAWAYLAFYNLVFVLPMLGITVLVVTGKATVDALREKKTDWLEKIHLVVGLLMLGLGGYVLADAFNLF